MDADYIRTTLDMTRVTGRAESGNCTWHESVHFVHTVMDVILRVQSVSIQMETAPVWKTFSESLQNASVEDQPCLFSTVLQFLLKCVNGLRIAEANKRLDPGRAVILHHGVAYEIGKFQDKLDAGVITVNRTKVCAAFWICVV